jgi:serine/threonine protein kinase
MLLGRHHEVVLSDFGIATIAHQTSSQRTEVMAGTLPYMAPEQIQGKPRPASDQYALGIAVYEWLSGSRPFHGTITEIAMQHMFTPPPSLVEKLPSITAEVEQVVLTALAKDSHQRFGSVQAFATALEQAAQTVPTYPGGVQGQVSEEKRSTAPSQPLLSTPVVTPPNQSVKPTGPATPSDQALLPTEPATSPGQALQPTEPVTHPSQPLRSVSGDVSPFSAKEVPAKDPLSPAAEQAMEEKRNTLPNQALLPTEPVTPPLSLLEPTIPASSPPPASVLPPSRWRDCP